MLECLSAAAMARGLRDREFSAVELTEAHLKHADPFGAYLCQDAELAMAQAQCAQERLDRKEGHCLTGVPYAAKDNLCTLDIPTSCASRMLEGYVSPYAATAVTRLGDLPLLGKTNMDEFAMGTSSENSAFYPCKNPWDTSRVPGGSSGGSAAAVAGFLAPLALGSDTGGSVRQPAALCGVVGLKPTYGRVSRYGLVAFASSFDQIGPLARSVEDIELVSRLIYGPDRHDSTMLPNSELGDCPRIDLKGRRFAVPKEMITGVLEPGVSECFELSCAKLREAGAEVEVVSFPEIEMSIAAYYVLAAAEASSNLARFDGIRFGRRLGSTSETRGRLFGHEVKERIIVGTYVLSAGYYDAYYLRAQALRRQIRGRLQELLERFDGLLSPTSPCVAFPLGHFEQDPLALKLLDLCTVIANLSGFPSISLPCGLSEGLPVGLQITSAHFSDEWLLGVSKSVEELMGFTTPKRLPT